MPAMADVGASVSLTNIMMLRGRSLSAGRPVGQFDLSYDVANGLYGGIAIGGIATRDKGVRLFDTQEYVGFAHPLSPRLTFDFGVLNSRYTSYSSNGRASGYTEIYSGVSADHVSAHIRYSPNYFRSNTATLYGEMDGYLGRKDGWQVILHGGLLRWLDDRKPNAAPTMHYDWQLGVARRFGALSAKISWTAGGPNQDYYNDRARGHGAWVAGIDFAF